MAEPSSISREHRMRVLENQAKIAAEPGASRNGPDPQLKMPLIVEVKRSPAKPSSRRTRRKQDIGQPNLEDL